jgi:acetyltransferase-like isoleucine patch superfamily enzyme
VKKSWRLYIANNIIGLVPEHQLRLRYYRNQLGFTIGRDTSILMRAWFDDTDKLVIGNNTVINQGCRLDTRGGIRIGDNVSISANVTILTADHDLRNASFAYRERPVDIGDRAFLGTDCLILPGVTIGMGAVVAAGSVVTRSIEPMAIVGGNPARVIGTRPTSALDYQLFYFPSLQ